MMETIAHTLDTVAPALLALFARGALLLAIAAVVAWALRAASASVRYLVWSSALCALLVLPLATVLAPDVALPILPSRAETTEPAVIPAPPTIFETPPVAPEEIAPPVRESAPASRRIELPPSRLDVSPSLVATSDAADAAWSWRGTAVGVWVVVALLLLAEIGRSRLRLRNLAGGAWRIHDPAWWRAADRIGKALGLRRPVLLLATERTRVPLTWGTRVPIVLLPADAGRWPAARREAVLVHELAHVARGDARGHDIARVAAALFWANPLVWVALRMMRAERERACDDLVLETGTRASSYAGDLLEIALTAGGRAPASAAALAMARPSELEGRLLAILDPAVSRRPAGRTARLGATALGIALLLPVAALRPAERLPVDRQVGVDRAMLVDALDAVPPPAALEPATASVRSAEQSAVASVGGLLDRDPIAAAATRSPADVTSITIDAPLATDASAAATIAPIAQASPIGAPSPASPQGRDDIETLIAVARAAASLSSDNEKAELLLAVLSRAVRNDSLQRVVLRSAATIGSSYDRHRVLLAMLRRSMVSGSEAEFIRATEGISSTHERTTVLTAFARADSLGSPAVRKAFLQAATNITSAYERTQLLALVIRLPGFDAEAALAVLPAVGATTSSYEKANLLVAIARRGVTADPAVREAFLVAAGSLTSDHEFGRVMRAAGLGGDARRQ